MNYKERFDQIVTFLSPYQEIWNNEILDLYPQKLEVFPREWIEFLNSLDEDILWRVDCLSDYELIPGTSFGKFLKQIDTLIQIPTYDFGELKELPSWAFHKVKGKKRHEIMVLSNFFKKKKDQLNFSHLVDIGGGVGHLARIMAHYEGIPCTSLDINPEFHDIGKKRLQKYPKPQGAKEVEFITHDFTNDLAGNRNAEIFNGDSFSLGLHTCGPLALRHMEVASDNQTKGFINFGCCFNKLNPKTDTNLSTHAKQRGLELHNYAMTLATRGHSLMDYEDFRLKRRVKYYRYALHFLLEEHLGLKVKSVKEAHPSLYWGEFSKYALDKLKYVGAKHSFSEQWLNEWYASSEVQSNLNLLFKANIIRWQFGRVLEFYILIDRVLALIDKGHKVKMKAFFDYTLSPRNIGIYTD